MGSGRTATLCLVAALTATGCLVGLRGAAALDVAHAAQHEDLWVSPTGNDAICVRSDRTKPCQTFQRAYDLARPGDAIAVRAGTYPANDPARGSITIFGNPKAGSAPVTFTCASSGQVTTSAPMFTIKAFHVKLVGSCFRLHALRFGEGGDTTLTTQDVTVEGVQMEGLEVVGAQQIVLRNVEIGPNVNCYAQGTTGVGSDGGPISPAMWCDPNGPAYEAFYANRGNADLPFQPYFHNNSGAINPTVVFEDSYVHDIQTKDAFNIHTSCGQAWTVPGAPANSIVFRGNRFENCAVLGLLFRGTDGVTIENNWFGYPTEPLSNGRGDDVEASVAQREVVLLTGEGWSPKNWLIRFNSFSHGLSIDNSVENPTYSNFRVIGNILGSYSYCENRGEVFDSNLFIGSACGRTSLTVPYGYGLIDQRLLVKKPEGAVVRSIFASAASGEKPGVIAKKLRRSGKGRWSAGSIRRVVENDLYLGAKVGAKGAHPALVSRRLWRGAQASLTR